MKAPDRTSSTAAIMRPEHIAIAPRGVSRIEAARYMGISPTKFDQMVADGSVPPSIQIGRRRVWDRCKLDEWFEARDDGDGAAEDGENPYRDVAL